MKSADEAAFSRSEVGPERNLLKELNDKQVDKTSQYLELLEDANTSVLGLKRELKGTQETLRVNEQKLGALEVESSKEVGRLRGELAATTRDRDALIGVIDQQEVALKLQNRQSEAGECGGRELLYRTYCHSIVLSFNITTFLNAADF